MILSVKCVTETANHYAFYGFPHHVITRIDRLETYVMSQNPLSYIAHQHFIVTSKIHCITDAVVRKIFHIDSKGSTKNNFVALIL